MYPNESEFITIFNHALLTVRPNYDLSSQTSKTYNVRGERISVYFFPEDGDPLATSLNGVAGLCMEPRALTELLRNRQTTIDLPIPKRRCKISYQFFLMPSKPGKKTPLFFAIYDNLVQAVVPSRCFSTEKALLRLLTFALQGDSNPYVVKPSGGARRSKQPAPIDCSTQINAGQDDTHSTKSDASLSNAGYVGDLKKTGMPGKSGISEHTRHVKSVLTMNNVILDLIPNADLSTQTSGVYNFYGADILIYSLAEHKDPLETFIQGLAALSEDRGDLESLITTNGAIIPLKDADGSRVDKYIFRLLDSTRPEKYILAVLYSGFILVEFPARHLWDEPDCLCPLAAFIGSETNPNDIKPWDGTAGK